MCAFTLHLMWVVETSVHIDAGWTIHENDHNLLTGTFEQTGQEILRLDCIKEWFGKPGAPKRQERSGSMTHATPIFFSYRKHCGTQLS